MPPAPLRITIIALAIFFLLPLFAPGGAVVHAAVVVNEILPKMDPATNEWVELYNNGTESVALDHWTLKNTSGTVTTFTIDTVTIPPKGFLLYDGTKTGIAFDINGDAVTLSDANGAVVDSQGFPGNMGFNTAMGRSEDGAGAWTFCHFPSPGAPNGTNCPAPSPTSTPIPATPTPIPPSATPVPEVPAIVPTLTDTPTPTPSNASLLTVRVPRTVMMQVLAVAGAWTVIAIIATIRKRKRKTATKRHEEQA